MELSRKEVQEEIQEKSLDLRTFLEAREMIRRRVLEVADSPSALTPLPQWSGTDAVLGTLDLVCHAIERTLIELRIMLRDLPEDTKPNLRIVTGDENG